MAKTKHPPPIINIHNSPNCVIHIGNNSRAAPSRWKWVEWVIGWWARLWCSGA